MPAPPSSREFFLYSFQECANLFGIPQSEAGFGAGKIADPHGDSPSQGNERGLIG
jgi:hypothetical protein